MTPTKAITILTRLSKCRTENCPEELHCGECDYGVSVDDCVEAFDVAVEALKNFQTQMSGTSANNSEIPNSSDLISRQAAIDAMEKYEKRVETAGQSWTIMCCENEILSLPSAQPEWNNHTVACLLAELFDDTCACNYNDIDEWLPEKCELLDSCPNPVGVACWEQFLKHKAERRTDERFNQQTGGD